MFQKCGGDWVRGRGEVEDDRELAGGKYMGEYGLNGVDR